jgi:hypothetical protein
MFRIDPVARHLVHLWAVQEVKRDIIGEEQKNLETKKQEGMYIGMRTWSRLICISISTVVGGKNGKIP